MIGSRKCYENNYQTKATNMINLNSLIQNDVEFECDWNGLDGDFDKLSMRIYRQRDFDNALPVLRDLFEKGYDIRIEANNG